MAELEPSLNPFLIASQDFDIGAQDIAVPSMATDSFLRSTQEYANVYKQLVDSNTGNALRRLPSLTYSANNVLSDSETLAGILFQRFDSNRQTACLVAANILFMHESILTSAFYQDIPKGSPVPTRVGILTQVLNFQIDKADKFSQKNGGLSQAAVFAYAFRLTVHINMSDWIKLYKHTLQTKTNNHI